MPHLSEQSASLVSNSKNSDTKKKKKFKTYLVKTAYHSLCCSVVETKLIMLDAIFVKPFPFNVVLFTPYKPLLHLLYRKARQLTEDGDV